VLFNVGKANQSVQNSEIHIVGDRTIEGRVDAGGFCAGNDRHTVYVSATFDRVHRAGHLARFDEGRRQRQVALLRYVAE
jgi:hypothetical protein